MFSPIPFLARSGLSDDSHAEAGGSGIGMDIDEPDQGRNGVEEPMSPLVLDRTELKGQQEEEAETGSSTTTISTSSGSSQPSTSDPTLAQSSHRSPTPEPEDQDTRVRLSGNESSDPAHQPYLGRVDELDTGPIIPNTVSSSSTTHTSIGTNPHLNGDHSPEGHGEAGMGGTGEGGNMTRHGMSDKPVPISATTTVVPQSEVTGGRVMAGLPRSRSVVGLNERFVGAQMEEGGKAEDTDKEGEKEGEE